jgi:hypothetical protein
VATHDDDSFDVLAINPVTNRVYTVSHPWIQREPEIHVIDPEGWTVLATIPLNEYSWPLAVNPLRNRVYAGRYVIDGKTNEIMVTAPFNVAGAVNPLRDLVYARGHDTTGSIINVIDDSDPDTPPQQILTGHIDVLLEKAQMEVPDLVEYLYDAIWYLEDTTPDNDRKAAWSLLWFAEEVARRDLLLQAEEPRHFGSSQARSNDACSSAVPIEVGWVVPGTTVGATDDPEAPLCGTSVTAPGVWYKVVGTGNTLTVSTCNDGNPGTGSADYDSKLNIYCEGCDTLTCVAGNDDGPDCLGYSSQVSWCSEAGAEYLILVQGFFGDIGDFELAVQDDGVACTTAVACGAPPPPPAKLNELIVEARKIIVMMIGD